MRLSRDRKPCRALLSAERAAQFCEGAIFQLSNPFARDTQSPPYFLKRFPLSAVESETLGNDSLFPIVQLREQAVDLIIQVFVAQEFKGRPRLFVRDTFAQLRQIIFADRRVE